MGTTDEHNAILRGGPSDGVTIHANFANASESLPDSVSVAQRTGPPAVYDKTGVRFGPSSLRVYLHRPSKTVAP